MQLNTDKNRALSSLNDRGYYIQERALQGNNLSDLQNNLFWADEAREISSNYNTHSEQTLNFAV